MMSRIKLTPFYLVCFSLWFNSSSYASSMAEELQLFKDRVLVAVKYVLNKQSSKTQVPNLANPVSGVEELIDEFKNHHQFQFTHTYCDLVTLQRCFKENDFTNLIEVYQGLLQNSSLTDNLVKIILNEYAEDFHPGWRTFISSHLKANGKETRDKVLASIFYPYPFMIEQGQASFAQLNPTMRLGILIAARHGDLIAQRIILTSSSEFKNVLPQKWEGICTFLTGEEISVEKYKEILETPFITTDWKMVDALKRVEDVSVPQSLTPLGLLNLGYIYLEKQEYKKAIESFTQASKKDPLMIKGDIEIGILYNSELKAEKPFEDVINSLFKGPYGSWKIAECYKYGRGVSPNILKANQYYKEAISGEPQIPLVFYDYAKFLEECAIVQEAPELKQKLWEQAVKHFKRAGELGLGEGYYAAARILHQGLVQSEKAAFVELYEQAAQKGYTTGVVENLKTLHIDSSRIQEVMKPSQELKKFTQELFLDIFEEK